MACAGGDPGTTNPSSTSSPQSLYRDGYFEQAASDFRCLARKRSRSTEEEEDDSTIRIRILAWEADASLCEVRSWRAANDNNSNGEEGDYASLCQRAIESNRRYAKVLIERLSSSIVSAAAIRHPATQKQSPATAAMVDAILLSAVAASWLYLQARELKLALNVLVEGGIQILQALSSAPFGVLALLPLDELLHRLEKAHNNVSPSAASNTAEQEYRHTLRVVCTINGINFPSADNDDDDGHILSGKAVPAVGDTDMVNGQNVHNDYHSKQMKVKGLLLRAVTIHKELSQNAATPHGNLALKQCRDNLLEKAVSLEEASPSSGVLAGRVRATIRALTIVHGSDDIYCDRPKCCNPLAQELEGYLGQHSVKCVPLWNLVGCLRAVSTLTDAAEHALRAFEQASELLLLQDHSSSANQSDTVIINMVECFLSLGDPGRALQILDYLQSRTNQEHVLSSTGSTKHLMSLSSEATGGRVCQTTVLWYTFVAASLLGESCTERQLETAESLLLLSNPQERIWGSLLQIFLYLQADCPRRALKEIEATRAKNKTRMHGVASVLLNLYEADARFHSSSAEDHCDRDIWEIRFKTMAAFRSLEDGSLGAGADRRSREEVRACLLNNRGLVNVVFAEKESALEDFRGARTALDSTVTDKRLLSSVSPHFNMCLLGLEFGASAPVGNEWTGNWLTVRGMPEHRDRAYLGAAFRGLSESVAEAEPPTTNKWKPFIAAVDHDYRKMDLIQMQSALYLLREGEEAFSWLDADQTEVDGGQQGIGV